MVWQFSKGNVLASCVVLPYFWWQTCRADVLGTISSPARYGFSLSVSKLRHGGLYPGQAPSQTCNISDFPRFFRHEEMVGTMQCFDGAIFFLSCHSQNMKTMFFTRKPGTKSTSQGCCCLFFFCLRNGGKDGSAISNHFVEWSSVVVSYLLPHATVSFHLTQTKDHHLHKKIFKNWFSCSRRHSILSVLRCLSSANFAQLGKDVAPNK